MRDCYVFEWERELHRGSLEEYNFEKRNFSLKMLKSEKEITLMKVAAARAAHLDTKSKPSCSLAVCIKLRDS